MKYFKSGNTYMRRLQDEAPELCQDCKDALTAFNTLEEVPEDDMQDAMVAIEVRNRMRVVNLASRGQSPTIITRSPQNIEIAEKLGITADEMADRLAKPDQNQGTMIRIPDDEFKAAMAKINLSEKEAKDRFDGRFWTG